MKKIWTILPAVAAFGAMPALAQEAGSGPRIEVRVGHDEVHSELEIDNSARRDEGSANGIGFGVEAGADFRVSSSFLVGAYVGADFSDVNECGEVFGDDELCTKSGRNFTVGARAGLPVTDGGLIYIKGGLSRANIRASYIDDDGDDRFDDKDAVRGYHLGAGFELGLGEVGLGDRFYVKGEYVHTRYRNAFGSDLGTGESYNPTRHQILVGAGVRF